MSEIFEPKPRGENIPKICLIANLPAFESAKAYYEWHEQFGKSCKVHKVWQCLACDKWHAETSAPDPAGNSSGTGRSSKSKADIERPDFAPTVPARRNQFSSDEAFQQFHDQ